MSRSMHVRWRVAVSRTVLAVALFTTGATLAACGGNKENPGQAGGANQSQSAPSSPSGQHDTEAAGQFNDADVEFAQNMIPHHEQAVTMAALAAAHASSPQIKQLAEKIKTAQAPEVATMKSWLSAWGKPAAPAGGHDGGHAMPGMMSEADMGKMTAAKGADFDRMFVQMMIIHHEGAIEMAKTEQAKGSNTRAKELAAAIARTQQAEIDTMHKLTGHK